jgi:phosphatidate cytidylyltransferase
VSVQEPPNGKQTRRSWADLGPRLASAVVLVPVTAIALYFGGYLFAAAVGAVFAGAYREWETMVTLKPLSPFGILLIGGLFVASLLYPQWGPLATLALVALGAIVALLRGGEGAIWRAGGLVYFGVVIIAVLGIRGPLPPGAWGALPLGIWGGVLLGAVIWLTDTGAFFTGRQIGGEKLAPDISPGKTRSGAIGGLVLGTIAGLVIWHFVTPSPLWIGLVFCAAMSVLGQLGDLAESALKRRFRIKDSGDIIPGHGGLMDRLDSLTFGALFFYAVGVLHLGQGMIAPGFLNW